MSEVIKSNQLKPFNLPFGIQRLCPHTPPDTCCIFVDFSKAFYADNHQNFLSKFYGLSCGVAQGTVLGPLLFIIK